MGALSTRYAQVPTWAQLRVLLPLAGSKCPDVAWLPLRSSTWLRAKSGLHVSAGGCLGWGLHLSHIQLDARQEKPPANSVPQILIEVTCRLLKKGPVMIEDQSWPATEFLLYFMSTLLPQPQNICSGSPMCAPARTSASQHNIDHHLDDSACQHILMTTWITVPQPHLSCGVSDGCDVQAIPERGPIVAEVQQAHGDGTRGLSGEGVPQTLQLLWVGALPL